MNNTQKLSVYVLCKQRNQHLEWHVDPPADETKIEDDCIVLGFDIPFGKIFRFRVVLQSTPMPDNYLHIIKVKLNDIELHKIFQCSTYLADGIGTITSASGFMNFKGQFMFTIRQNALVHNYLSSWSKLDSPASEPFLS
jgi:hypothetical protein